MEPAQQKTVYHHPDSAKHMTNIENGKSVKQNLQKKG